MAQKSTKMQDGSITSMSLKFNGGLNLSEAEGNIGDNELVRLYNYIYNSQTGTPQIRPGTRCQTAAVCDSTNPILKIYNYEKSSASKWIVCACNGNLYYLSGATLNAWTKIGALNDTSTVPSFLTYHAKLLIADGGTNIKTWDGTTYSALADGLGATALAQIKGRVVANSSGAGSNDLVTMSGVQDETMWNVSDGTNPAMAIRAGYGDNMSVNAFSVFGDDLIVSKTGSSQKRLYRINTSGATASQWYASSLSNNNCSQSAHTIVQAFNDVYFVDTNGFKSVKGVTEYGDLQVDLIGAKINSIFTASSNTCTELMYVPYYTALWFLMGERIYCYHRLIAEDGSVKHAFSDLLLQQGRIRSICQSGNTIYLAGNNGYLYTFDTTDTYATDETTQGVTANYTSSLIGKKFTFFGQGILRRTELYLTPLKAGTANLSISTPSNDDIIIKAVTLKAKGTYLYDATGDLYDETGTLYGADTLPWYEITHNKVRGSSLQFKFTSASGRVGVEGLKAEIAIVEG